MLKLSLTPKIISCLLMFSLVFSICPLHAQELDVVQQIATFEAEKRQWTMDRDSEIKILREKEGRLEQIKQSLLLKIEEFKSEKDKWESGQKEQTNALFEREKKNKEWFRSAVTKIESERKNLDDLQREVEKDRAVIEARLKENETIHNTATPKDISQKEILKNQIQALNQKIQFKDQQLSQAQKSLAALQENLKAQKMQTTEALKMDALRIEQIKKLETRAREDQTAVSRDKQALEREKQQWQLQRSREQSAIADKIRELDARMKVFEKQTQELILAQQSLSNQRAQSKRRMAWIEKREKSLTDAETRAGDLSKIEWTKKQLMLAKTEFEKDRIAWKQQQEQYNQEQYRQREESKAQFSAMRKRELELQQQMLWLQGERERIEKESQQLAARRGQQDSELSEQQKALQNKVEILRKQLQEKNQNTQALETENAAFQQKQADLAAREQKLTESLQVFQKEKDRMEWTRKQFEIAKQNFEKQVAEHQAGKSKRGQLEAWEKSLKKRDGRSQAALMRQREEIETRKTALEKRERQWSEQYDKQLREIQGRKSLVEKSEQELREKTLKLESGEREIADRSKEIQNKESHLQSLENQIGEREKKLKTDRDDWEREKRERQMALLEREMKVDEVRKEMLVQIQKLREEKLGWNQQSGQAQAEISARENRVNAREEKVAQLEKQLISKMQEFYDAKTEAQSRSEKDLSILLKRQSMLDQLGQRFRKDALRLKKIRERNQKFFQARKKWFGAQSGREDQFNVRLAWMRAEQISLKAAEERLSRKKEVLDNHLSMLRAREEIVRGIERQRKHLQIREAGLDKKRAFLLQKRKKHQTLRKNWEKNLSHLLEALRKRTRAVNQKNLLFDRKQARLLRFEKHLNRQRTAFRKRVQDALNSRRDQFRERESQLKKAHRQVHDRERNLHLRERAIMAKERQWTVPMLSQSSETVPATANLVDSEGPKLKETPSLFKARATASRG